MSIFNLIPVTFSPKRSIGDIIGYITIEEKGEDPLEITEKPVQQGASITDHAFIKQAELSLKIMFNSDSAPLEETYQNLLDLRNSREPIKITTGKRAYDSMLLRNIIVDTDKTTENVLSVFIEAKQIRIVSLETTSVSQRSNQKNPGKTAKTEKAGQKSALPASEERKREVRSILAATAGR